MRAAARASRSSSASTKASAPSPTEPPRWTMPGHTLDDLRARRASPQQRRAGTEWTIWTIFLQPCAAVTAAPLAGMRAAERALAARYRKPASLARCSALWPRSRWSRRRPVRRSRCLRPSRGLLRRAGPATLWCGPARAAPPATESPCRHRLPLRPRRLAPLSRRPARKRTPQALRPGARPFRPSGDADLLRDIPRADQRRQPVWPVPCV